MSHASIPDFSVPLALPPVALDRERVPFHADPVLAAIEAHEEAYAVFQVAVGDEASMRASDEYEDARTTLLATPCATRFGAFALLRHLRWWLSEEAVYAADYEPSYGIAQAREADLSLLLGCDGVRRIPVALPLGRLASVPVLPEAPKPLVIEAEPARAPALVRLGRAVTSAGDLLAAFVLVGGGCLLCGFASLL